VNVSPSVPLGLYHLTAVREPLARGTLVVLPVPASVRTWQHIPLLKPIAGVSGDDVWITPDGVWINTMWYGPVLREARGMPLPWHPGCHRVADGRVFVASAMPNSLDSRYFGDILVTSLVAIASPLWTWRYPL